MAERESVDLSALIKAARLDANDDDGHYPTGALIVEKALHAEGLLGNLYVEGYFGTNSVDAYAAWQRSLGYSGKDADGIPGRKSLTALGRRHGFTVRD
ncbi:hypothetical protein HUT18_18340 [Streptomyces sp. NA04227]|uniref:hypothetical protein n=1 Tax=Streptomyces sp. NA04227 TaxID=2742136 RepID=UPI00159005DE|nr:hypothetical protein [Streptomyces sp. NA04227]QKW08047.1 hypothetical protein HUT18_18340 [Streptomyces sp. NA04227]